MAELLKTKREHLYEVAAHIALAKEKRDMSPLDLAPDGLACMESLDGVYLEAFGEHLLPRSARLSTKAGYEFLLTDPRVEQVTDPLPGDIGIAPSGYSTKGAEHGHCCIRGIHTMMSNDSNTGMWLANYTLEAWDNVFRKLLGFHTTWFRVID